MLLGNALVLWNGVHVNILKSDVKIDPSRSAFMKERIEVMYEGDDLESILKQVEQIDLGATFKVIFVKINDLVGE